MLSERQAFKAGFLARCAEEGLDPAATEERVRRGVEKAAGITSKAIGLPILALAGATGLGGTLGYGAGIGAAKLQQALSETTSPLMNNDIRAKAVQTAEKAQLYKRLADEARQRRQERDRRRLVEQRQPKSPYGI